MDKFKEGSMEQAHRKQLWRPPTVTTVGTLGKVLQNGLGKTSVRPGDPGEVMKNSHHE
jgi:hypothetical protein